MWALAFKPILYPRVNLGRWEMLDAYTVPQLIKVLYLLHILHKYWIECSKKRLKKDLLFCFLKFSGSTLFFFIPLWLHNDSSLWMEYKWWSFPIAFSYHTLYFFCTNVFWKCYCNPLKENIIIHLYVVQKANQNALQAAALCGTITMDGVPHKVAGV